MQEIKVLTGLVDPTDAPILASAIREQFSYLATFNVRHDQPGGRAVVALTPGDLIKPVRYLLSVL